MRTCYCIADSVTGEVSEYAAGSTVNYGNKIRATIATALPGNYVYRVVLIKDRIYDTTVLERFFYHKDLTAVGSMRSIH